MTQLVSLFIYLILSFGVVSSNKVSLSTNEFGYTICISNTNNSQISYKATPKK